MSWTTTQQQQPQYQLWSAPSGWAGSWPPTAPAGYPGPPPIPTGVNPQAWTSGRWQFNPMFRGPVPQAGQAGIPAWAPHPSWGPQAASAYAAAANYNPYKRQANPGDRDYWSTKLSDNPLGLENMHIRETEHKKTRENGVMHTPWVWVPKELCESPEKEGLSDVPSGRDGNEGAEGRERGEGSRAQGSHLTSREPSRSRHERSAPSVDASRYPQERSVISYGSSASTAARDTASRQPRAQERPELQQRNDPAAVRSPRDASRTRADEPNVVPPPPPNMPNGYASAYSTYSQQHQRQRSRDVSPRPADAAQPRPSPNPPTSSASAAAAAAAMQSKQSSLEAFSSKQQLHPTFSPSIVRTPKHYSSASISTPTRRSTTDESHSASAHARRASGEPPSQSTTPSRRLSGDDTHYSTPTPAARRSTHEDSHTTAVSPGHHQHGPIYAPASAASTSASTAPSRSNSLSKRRSSAPTPASGSPTSDATPLPFLASFSEEPEGLLSPLITAPRGLAGGPSTRESPPSRSASSGRDVARSATYPSLSASSTFEAIPEDRAVPQSRTPKPRDSERGRYSDPESTPYAGVRSPPRSSHASPEAAPQKMARSATYPILDERQSAAYSHASSRSPPTHAHAQSSYASSRSPSTQPSPSYASTQPSPSYTSSRSPPTYNARSPNAPAKSPRSPTEATHSRSREPSRSRGASPSRSHNPLPRPPMPSSYPTTMSSASASAYSSASKAQPAAAYSSGTHTGAHPSSTYTSANTRSVSTYPSNTQPASAYSSSSQPAPTYSSSTQPATKYSSNTQPASSYPSGTQPSAHHHHRSSSTQPSSMYTSASQSSSTRASHKQPTSSYSSSAQHHHHSSSSAAAAYSSASAVQASSAYSAAPTPQPANRSPSRKVRKGYWNRRGDHLVYDHNRWCIVYAPREQANPPELSQYPAPTEGFMDHQGNKAKYDPSVPELPESLPSHGEPPKRPYEEFVQYVHV